jgi:hypothetical protein
MVGHPTRLRQAVWRGPGLRAWERAEILAGMVGLPTGGQSHFALKAAQNWDSLRPFWG